MGAADRRPEPWSCSHRGRTRAATEALALAREGPPTKTLRRAGWSLKSAIKIWQRTAPQRVRRSPWRVAKHAQPNRATSEIQSDSQGEPGPMRRSGWRRAAEATFREGDETRNLHEPVTELEGLANNPSLLQDQASGPSPSCPARNGHDSHPRLTLRPQADDDLNSSPAPAHTTHGHINMHIPDSRCIWALMQATCAASEQAMHSAASRLRKTKYRGPHLPPSTAMPQRQCLNGNAIPDKTLGNELGLARFQEVGREVAGE